MIHISPNYNTDYFKEGDEVMYIPVYTLEDYAQWIKDGCDQNHLDNYAKFSKGIVKSSSVSFIFVNYFIRGELSETSNATDPKDLILWKLSKEV